MPRSGSGVYGPPAGTTAVPNTTIESSKYNAFVTDVSQALTDSVNVQGTAPWQGDQPMGGNKLTNLGAGTATTDSARLDQVQVGTLAAAASVGGTADAITLSFSPPFTAYTDKMRFRFTATGANTVADPTANVDGLGAKTIKKLEGAALSIGDISGAGHVCECVYNGTDVLLLNPALLAQDRKQTFNAPVVHGTTELTDAATIAWDLSTGGPNYKVTITSNRTLGAFTGSTDGQEGYLTVIQDGTGGWSLNVENAVYDYYGGFVENIARGANDETVYHYRVLSSGSMLLKRMGATSIGVSGRDLLSAQAASGSATIDFVLTKWLQLYDRFEVDFEDVLPTSDNTILIFRTSADGGSTYDSGATNYRWLWQRFHTSVDQVASTGDSSIPLIDNNGGIGMSNTANETAAGTIVIHNPAAAGRLKVSWRATFIAASGSVPVRFNGMGSRDAAAAVDAVRFLCSSGNIASGSFRLYGIRK